MYTLDELIDGEIAWREWSRGISDVARDGPTWADFPAHEDLAPEFIAEALTSHPEAMDVPFTRGYFTLLQYIGQALYHVFGNAMLDWEQHHGIDRNDPTGPIPFILGRLEYEWEPKPSVRFS